MQQSRRFGRSTRSVDSTGSRTTHADMGALLMPGALYRKNIARVLEGEYMLLVLTPQGSGGQL